MPDPLSLIALGAAVGGAAGKVVERTWDSAERWLRERFGSHAADVQEQARLNSALFVRLLAERVEHMETARRLDEAEAVAAESHPQVSAVLQQSLLSAAQTSDATKHALLADLVAQRLAAAHESTFALAAPMAATAIAGATRRQLTLLALMCLLDEVTPLRLRTAEDYARWLDDALTWFLDAEYEFAEIDARHLVALSCVTFQTNSTRDLRVALQFKVTRFALDGVPEAVDGVDAVDWLQHEWDMGLSGVRLTSVGSIVGTFALNHLTGAKVPPPHWDEDDEA